MPEKLTKKQKAAIRKAKEADIDSKMRKKVNKDFPAYGDKWQDVREGKDGLMHEYPYGDDWQKLESDKKGNMKDTRHYKKGGMVRGHGCAKRGHKKLRMR